ISASASSSVGSRPIAFSKTTRPTAGSGTPLPVTAGTSTSTPCSSLKARFHARSLAPPVEISVPSMSKRIASVSRSATRRSSRLVRLGGLRLSHRLADHRGRSANVLCARAPVAHRDPNRGTPPPAGSRQPAGPVVLDPLDCGSGRLPVLVPGDPDQDLVDHDLVQHLQ